MRHLEVWTVSGRDSGRGQHRRVPNNIALAQSPAGTVADVTQRPLTIVIIMPSLGAGGTERVVNFLANRWAGHGWRITVLTLCNADEPSFYPYDPMVEIHRTGLPPRRRAALTGAWSAVRRVHLFRQLIGRIRPDLVVSFLSRTNVLALLACTGLAIPVVVSERNNPARQQIGPLWNTLRSLLYRRAFGLVTMTKGALDYFPDHPRRRHWIIPNFATPGDAKPPAKQPAEQQRIVAVGRLVDQKGFDLLIEAFAQIADRFPDWKLVIWGEGEDRQALEQQRDQLGMQSRIELPGISREYGGWIESADAFVLSSRYEGWGIALLEAMAAGQPVIAFDCQWGPGEMINHGVDGLIVPRENIGGLASAMAAVIADPALRLRLGKAARKSARRFTPEAAGAAWDQVAIETASRGPGQTADAYMPSVMNTR